MRLPSLQWQAEWNSRGAASPVAGCTKAVPSRRCLLCTSPVRLIMRRWSSWKARFGWAATCVGMWISPCGIHSPAAWRKRATSLGWCSKMTATRWSFSNSCTAAARSFAPAGMGTGGWACAWHFHEPNSPISWPGQWKRWPVFVTRPRPPWPQEAPAIGPCAPRPSRAKGVATVWPTWTRAPKPRGVSAATLALAPTPTDLGLQMRCFGSKRWGHWTLWTGRGVDMKPWFALDSISTAGRGLVCWVFSMLAASQSMSGITFTRSSMAASRPPTCTAARRRWPAAAAPAGS
mmetsp:Transcript_90067/g.194886  ORF Transcript_90067/g.194886 Transcript_90067/m.194886 type:complete len:290 (+) Transcript_90067:253-1122(+)